MSTFTTTDGTEIFYKDFGNKNGQTIVFSHGWPLSADAWEDQLVYLASAGYRVIAHDRRGHGRSAATWSGNDMDTYASDLNQLIEKLNLSNAIFVGHSTGGGEVTRYLGKYGTKRASGAVLISAVTPLMIKSASNPNGVDKSVFDGLRTSTAGDRSQLFKDLSGPFYGANREGSKVTQGQRDTFWLIGMQGDLKAEIDCIAAFSETDLTEDLKSLDIPVLFIHGDDDQIVPIDVAARRAHPMVKGSQLKEYKGGAHGLPTTHKTEISADIDTFAKSLAANQMKKAS